MDQPMLHARKRSLDLVKQAGFENIILAGNFNANPESREGHLIELFTLCNNLTMHVKEPARITPTSATILDQYISNIPNIFLLFFLNQGSDLDLSSFTPHPLGQNLNSLEPFKHMKFKLPNKGKGPPGPPNLEAMITTNEDQFNKGHPS